MWQLCLSLFVQFLLSSPCPFPFPPTASPQLNLAKELRSNISEIPNCYSLCQNQRKEALLAPALREKQTLATALQSWGNRLLASHYVHSSQLLQLFAAFGPIIFCFLFSLEAKHRWGGGMGWGYRWRWDGGGHRNSTGGITGVLGAGDRNLQQGQKWSWGTGSTADGTEDTAVCVSAGPLKLVTSRRGNLENRSLPKILTHFVYFLCRT